MKTTVELSDDLLREIKARAARSGRSMRDLMDELLRHGLRAVDEPPVVSASRASFPLVACRRPADDADELTPERVAALLLSDDAQHAAS